MTMKRATQVWLPLIALALTAILLLAACGSSSDASGSSGGGGSSAGGSGGGSTPTQAPPASASAEEVTIAGSAFSPAKLMVAAGSTVTWTNQDGVGHTVTSTDGPGTDAATTSLFDSGTLTQGQTFSFTFDKAGTYFYECTIHATMASMHAEVVVQ